MAGTPTPIFPQTITNSSQTITINDGTNIKTLYTAGSNGSVVESLISTSILDNPDDQELNLYITQSGVDYLVFTIPVAIFFVNKNILTYANDLYIESGLSSIFNSNADGNPYIYLSYGSSLSIGVSSTLAPGSSVSIIAQGGDY